MTRLSRLLCTVFVLLARMAAASGYPMVAIDPGAVCHPSVQEAAVAGLLAAATSSRRVEYGGAIFQRDAHCFVHSVPVTNNLADRLGYVVSSPRGHLRLAGIYHTHTPGGHAQAFSAADVDTHLRLDIPSYIGTLEYTGCRMVVRSLTGSGRHGHRIQVGLIGNFSYEPAQPAKPD